MSDNQSAVAKTGSRPHQYKCGVCSEEGHNSRNCPLRTQPYRGAPKSATISPTKNNGETLVHSTPSQQQAPIGRGRQDVPIDNGILGREWPTDNHVRHASSVVEMYGATNPLNEPLGQAVTNAKRRVLQCAEHVSSYAIGGVSAEDYNTAVSDLVSSMDSLERVVKCAMRFTAVSDGSFDASDPYKKRRRADGL